MMQQGPGLHKKRAEAL